MMKQSQGYQMTCREGGVNTAHRPISNVPRKIPGTQLIGAQ